MRRFRCRSRQWIAEQHPKSLGEILCGNCPEEPVQVKGILVASSTGIFLPIHDLVDLGHEQSSRACNEEVELPPVTWIERANPAQVSIDQGALQPGDLAGGLPSMWRDACGPTPRAAQGLGNQQVEPDHPHDPFYVHHLLPHT